MFHQINLRLEHGVQIRVSHIDQNEHNPLDFGGAGIVAEDGTMCTDQISVS